MTSLLLLILCIFFKNHYSICAGSSSTNRFRNDECLVLAPPDRSCPTDGTASFLPTMPCNRDIHGHTVFFFLSSFFLPILGDTKTAENTRRLRGAADVPIQSVRCRIWMIISHLIDLLGGNMPLPPPLYAAGQAGWLGWSGRCLQICILKPHASSITDSGMLIKIYILFCCCCCCRLFCAAGPQPGMHTDAKTDFGSWKWKGCGCSLFLMGGLLLCKLISFSWKGYQFTAAFSIAFFSVQKGGKRIKQQLGQNMAIYEEC